jgi:predicted flavoprotein YhiN
MHQLSSDVLIVGAGSAGMICDRGALGGASVILLDKVSSAAAVPP